MGLSRAPCGFQPTRQPTAFCCARRQGSMTAPPRPRLVPPLGSSAYGVGPFDAGHYIAFDRVPDYWGKDLAVNIGQANFDRVRFEYFGDRKVAFEAFKAGVFTFREEFTSAV